MASLGITVLGDDGTEVEVYAPQSYQVAYHTSDAPNLLLLGTRGSGKSTVARGDAIMRCLLFPGFKALIIRRTMPELRESHLKFIELEMKQVGGVFLSGTSTAKFPNGSSIRFGHCETESDVLNFLSSEYDLIFFDELSTFSLEQFLKISAAARSPKGKPYKALVRAGSNPLGPGAQWMKEWFIDKNVNLEDFPGYKPEDFEYQFSSFEQNEKLDRDEYRARLRNLPEHVRRAWLNGEFVIEGAYFTDFRPWKNDKPWHVIDEMPTWQKKNGDRESIFNFDWISIYRAIDWGYFPDPAVCLWLAVLPNKKTIVFKEKTWRRTLAMDVAKDIKRESEGMRIVDTFCDPTMLIQTGVIHSVGDEFENNGIALTPSINNRELYGYAIHDYLNTTIDNQPQLQIVAPMGSYGCPHLIRTIPMMQMDPKDTRKIADGDDHWVVALAYFCMTGSQPTHDPIARITNRWQIPKAVRRIQASYGMRG